MSILDVVTLTLTDTLTMNFRVKRHLISTSNQKHGRPAETEPDSTICTHSLSLLKDNF
jgi:hypothetical protein